MSGPRNRSPLFLLPYLSEEDHYECASAMPVMDTPRCLPFCEDGCEEAHHPLLVALNNFTDVSSTEQFRRVVRLVRDFFSSHEVDDDVPYNPSPFQYPLLHWAAVLAKPQIVKYLLKSWAQPKCLPSQYKHETALHRMVLNLHHGMKFHENESPVTDVLHMFDELLELLEDALFAKDDNSDTPLHVCASYIVDCIPEPSSSYVGNDQRFLQNEFPLFHGYLIRMMRKCSELEHSKQYARSVFRMQNSEGNTILHILCRSKQSRINSLIKVYMSYDRPMSLRNACGDTVEDVAREHHAINLQLLGLTARPTDQRMKRASVSNVDIVARKRHRESNPNALNRSDIPRKENIPLPNYATSHNATPHDAIQNSNTSRSKQQHYSQPLQLHDKSGRNGGTSDKHVSLASVEQEQNSKELPKSNQTEKRMYFKGVRKYKSASAYDMPTMASAYPQTSKSDESSSQNKSSHTVRQDSLDMASYLDAEMNQMSGTDEAGYNAEPTGSAAPRKTSPVHRMIERSSAKKKRAMLLEGPPSPPKRHPGLPNMALQRRSSASHPSVADEQCATVPISQAVSPLSAVHDSGLPDKDGSVIMYDLVSPSSRAGGHSPQDAVFVIAPFERQLSSEIMLPTPPTSGDSSPVPSQSPKAPTAPSPPAMPSFLPQARKSAPALTSAAISARKQKSSSLLSQNHGFSHHALDAARRHTISDSKVIASKPISQRTDPHRKTHRHSYDPTDARHVASDGTQTPKAISSTQAITSASVPPATPARSTITCHTMKQSSSKLVITIARNSLPVPSESASPNCRPNDVLEQTPPIATMSSVPIENSRGPASVVAAPMPHRRSNNSQVTTELPLPAKGKASTGVDVAKAPTGELSVPPIRATNSDRPSSNSKSNSPVTQKASTLHDVENDSMGGMPSNLTTQSSAEATSEGRILMRLDSNTACDMIEPESPGCMPVAERMDNTSTSCPKLHSPLLSSESRPTSDEPSKCEKSSVSATVPEDVALNSVGLCVVEVGSREIPASDTGCTDKSSPAAYSATTMPARVVSPGLARPTSGGPRMKFTIRKQPPVTTGTTDCAAASNEITAPATGGTQPENDDAMVTVSTSKAPHATVSTPAASGSTKTTSPVLVDGSISVSDASLVRTTSSGASVGILNSVTLMLKCKQEHVVLEPSPRLMAMGSPKPHTQEATAVCQLDTDMECGVAASLAAYCAVATDGVDSVEEDVPSYSVALAPATPASNATELASDTDLHARRLSGSASRSYTSSTESASVASPPIVSRPLTIQMLQDYPQLRDLLKRTTVDPHTGKMVNSCIPQTSANSGGERPEVGGSPPYLPRAIQTTAAPTVVTNVDTGSSTQRSPSQSQPSVTETVTACTAVTNVNAGSATQRSPPQPLPIVTESIGAHAAAPNVNAGNATQRSPPQPLPKVTQTITAHTAVTNVNAGSAKVAQTITAHTAVIPVNGNAGSAIQRSPPQSQPKVTQTITAHTAVINGNAGISDNSRMLESSDAYTVAAADGNSHQNPAMQMYATQNVDLSRLQPHVAADACRTNQGVARSYGGGSSLRDQDLRMPVLTSNRPVLPEQHVTIDVEAIQLQEVSPVIVSSCSIGGNRRRSAPEAALEGSWTGPVLSASGMLPAGAGAPAMWHASELQQGQLPQARSFRLMHPPAATGGVVQGVALTMQNNEQSLAAWRRQNAAKQAKLDAWRAAEVHGQQTSQVNTSGVDHVQDVMSYSTSTMTQNMTEDETIMASMKKLYINNMDKRTTVMNDLAVIAKKKEEGLNNLSKIQRAQDSIVKQLQYVTSQMHLQKRVLLEYEEAEKGIQQQKEQAEHQMQKLQAIIYNLNV